MGQKKNGPTILIGSAGLIACALAGSERFSLVCRSVTQRRRGEDTLIDWQFDTVIYPPESFDEDTGMSAFGVIYTNEGFVLSADGLRIQSDVPPESPQFVKSDEVQKLFSIQDSDRTLAYILAGIAGSDDGEFDTYKEAARQAVRLSKHRFHGLLGYTENFCHNLNHAFNLAIKQKHFGDLTTIEKLNEVPGAWKTLTVIFAGYFRGAPSWVKAEFFHYDHTKSEYFVKPLPVQAGARFFHAPQTIIDLTYPDPRNKELKPDARFSQYIHPIGSKVSIEGNAKALEGLIKACCDPVAQQIDNKCMRIGGHVHIAEITPEGFRWRIPPIKKPAISGG